MSQFDIRIQLRTDTPSNWTSNNPTLRIGEMGFAIVGGIVKEVKVGLGLPWNSTPTLLIPFEPIVTTTGRNLDYPTLRNASYNLTTQNEVNKIILNPYVAPTLSISPNFSIPAQEVGATYNPGTVGFNFNYTNIQNILVESGNKKVYLDGSSTGTVLSFTGSTGNESKVVTKAVSVTSNVSGTVNLITGNIKRSDTEAFIGAASVTVPFEYRSGFFIWKNNDDVRDKSDLDITTIVKGIGANLPGVRETKFAGGVGTKTFNTINFDTNNLPSSDAAALGGNGFFDIYVFANKNAGTPVLYNPAAGISSPLTLDTVKDFDYTHGGATTGYRLYKTKSADKIVGTTTLVIA